MNSYLFKIKQIIPYCIIILVAASLIYGLLRWLLSFVSELEFIKEEAWDLFLPMILCAVIYWTLLRKRFWIIATKEFTKMDFRDALQMVTAIALVIMMGLSQSYVFHRFAKKQHVETFDQISKDNTVRYYEINSFDLEINRSGYYIENRSMPKRSGSDLNFTFYAVFPFSGDNNSWYGLRFTKTISRSSDSKTQREYGKFITYCNDQIENYKFHHHHLFERIAASDDKDGFLRAITNSDPTAITKEAIILTPLTDGYVDKSESRLLWVFGTLGIWLMLTLVLCIKAPINNQMLRRDLTLRKTKKPYNEGGDDSLELFFIPNKNNWSVAIILDLILIYFVIMIIGGVNPMSSSSLELYEWGALRTDSLYNGQWWRVVTSIFMHGNIMHLICNLVVLITGLFFIGGLFSIHRIAILFLCAGIIANITAALLFEGIYVGASGAIMGVMGAVLAVYAVYNKKGVQTVGLLWIGITTGITLLFGIQSGISNTAHITGLLVGAVLGLLLFKAPPAKQRRKRQQPNNS